MKFKYLTVFAVIVTIYSCTSKQKKEPKLEISPSENPIRKDTMDRIKPKINYDTHLITDANVAEKLFEYGKRNPETQLWVYTRFGRIKIKLYRDTPLHRAAFLLWVKNGFYDGSMFMRVSPNFIAQGGTTNSVRQMEIKRKVGNFTIPAEFKSHLFHKRGALAFARSYDENPEKRSDSHRFYFVEGTLYNKPTLDRLEKETGRIFSEEVRNYYLENIGAAHLDFQHTVFGEVLEGNDLISKITRVETDSREWPLIDLYIDSIRIIR